MLRLAQLSSSQWESHHERKEREETKAPLLMYQFGT